MEKLLLKPVGWLEVPFVELPFGAPFEIAKGLPVIFGTTGAGLLDWERAPPFAARLAPKLLVGLNGWTELPAKPVGCACSGEAEGRFSPSDRAPKEDWNPVACP